MLKFLLSYMWQENNKEKKKSKIKDLYSIQQATE